MRYIYNFRGCFFAKQPFLLPLLFLFTLLILGSACSQVEIPEEERILFSVNDFELNVFDFEQAYVRHLIETGQNDTKSERYLFMNKWIDEMLLAQEASNMDYLSNEAYQRTLALEKRKKMADVYFVDEMNKTLDPPTDDELRIAFGKSKRKVFVRHLFSRNPNDLTESYARLQNGDSFVDVANDFYATEEYDSLAGYIGPVSYFGADHAFAEAAFLLNQGEFSEPVRSVYGYHIIFAELIHFPAILTEDEYQTKIDGTTSQVQIRQQALESNDYIYNLMSSLDVDVDAPKILELREAIAKIGEEGEEIRSIQASNEEIQWDNSKVDRLGIEFDPDEILATYMLNGEAFSFTFADYLQWLTYLPFEESKVNTGASIGRALRNQVLFQLAESNGYGENDFVAKELKKTGYAMLSKLYMYDIISEAIKDTTEWNVPSGFRDRLIKNVNYILDSDYWMIKVGSQAEAREVKAQLNSGVEPSSFSGFEAFTDTRVDEIEPNYNIIRDGLLATPSIAFSETDGWMILNVMERDIIREEGESLTKVDVQKRYKAFKSVEDVVDSLRQIADISVDTTLFYEIYDLRRNKDEDSGK